MRWSSFTSAGPVARCRWVARMWLVAWGAIATVGAAELTLEIEPRWAGSALTVPSPELVIDSGQRARITRLAALVAEVALHRTDGSEVRLDGQYALFDAAGGRRHLRFSDVPAGKYDGISLVLGVPSEVNHADPARWPAGHALHPIVNGLHWSWQGGYVFAALEGQWRGTGESVERGFVYHIATDAHLRRVVFRSLFSVVGDHEIKLAWDVGRVFAGRALRTDDGSDSTHSGAGDALAGKLADALARGWFWLGDRPAPTDPVAVAAKVQAASTVGTPLAFVVPAGFPQPLLPADNPLTREGVELGRRLFADPRLSGTGTQACASCHQSAYALGDNVALSHGVRGKTGRRNAMALFNLAWSPAFAWDGSQARVRDQALAAWRNPREMDTDPVRVLPELAADPHLAALAQGAFGVGGLTVERVLLALEQYLLTEVSANSRFDRAQRGEATLTPQEQRGFMLFMSEYDPARGQRGADCFHCHGGALFTDFGFRNIGLSAGQDAGREAVTQRAADRGRFKTPSLRNVALTAPYMHDGRFATLAEVVAHYDHGVRRGSNLDPNLAKHPDAGLGLSPEDQRALVAFLMTLTDEPAPSGGATVGASASP